MPRPAHCVEDEDSRSTFSKLYYPCPMGPSTIVLLDKAILMVTKRHLSTAGRFTGRHRASPMGVFTVAEGAATT